MTRRRRPHPEEPIVPRRLLDLLAKGGEHADYGVYRRDGRWRITLPRADAHHRFDLDVPDAANAEEAALALVTTIVSKFGHTVRALTAEVEAAQHP